MSTKVTILYESGNNDYHFYYDYKDSRYHLNCKKKHFNAFLKRVAKILENCPLSDCGISSYDFDTKETKKEYSPECPYLKKKVKKK